MRRPSLTQIIFNATFPRPRPDDPSSFAVHVTRNLVPEVRIETQNFYGSLDDVEAQYPGLDYADAAHRMRLSRFPWHRKLFYTMDELGLTSGEIDSICRWEGTKSARRNYEREEGITVRDTTAEGIPLDDRSGSPISYIDPYHTYPGTPTVSVHARGNRNRIAPLRNELPAHSSGGRRYSRRYSGITHPSSRADAYVYVPDSSASEEDLDNSDGNMPLNSYGIELNQRLLVATEARARGHDIPVDEAYEQWLKDAAERGDYSNILYTIRTTDVSGHDGASANSELFINNSYPQYLSQRPSPTASATFSPLLSTPVSRRDQTSTRGSRRDANFLRPAARSVRRT